MPRTSYERECGLCGVIYVRVRLVFSHWSIVLRLLRGCMSPASPHRLPKTPLAASLGCESERPDTLLYPAPRLTPPPPPRRLLDSNSLDRSPTIALPPGQRLPADRSAAAAPPSQRSAAGPKHMSVGPRRRRLRHRCLRRSSSPQGRRARNDASGKLRVGGRRVRAPPAEGLHRGFPDRTRAGASRVSF